MMLAPLRSNSQRLRIARPATMPPPVGGLDTSTALAAMDKDKAVQLLNWFPQPGYVEVRKGYDWHAWDIGSGIKTISTVDDTNDELDSTAHGFVDGDRVKVYATTTIPAGLSTSRTYYVVGASANSFSLALTEGGAEIDITSTGAGTIYAYKVDDSEPVESLMVYQGQAASKMFAAAGGAIWDVTATKAAFPSLTGLTDDRWQHTIFANSGATYLYCVNGVDSARHYNGSSWATPTINNLTSSDAVGINAHKNRIWFVEKDSFSAWYLAAGAIAGDATEFPLGGVFTTGGYLMAMATWTRDGGSGSDDYAVFISSRGQAAIYQGTDPASADTFALVGVFNVPAPIGRRCFTRFGADVLLITVEGVFPLSQLLSVDQSQARRVAITQNIAPSVNTAARSYKGNHGWEACVYYKGTRLILNVPTSEAATARQFVMNTLTGAWCEFDNHNAICWTVYEDRIFFGGVNGAVYEADKGSADIDTPITAIGQSAYQPFTNPGTLKRFTMMQPLVTSSEANRPSLGISVDFQETAELSVTSTETTGGGALWDVAQWDVFEWGGGESQINDWVSVPALGRFASIKFLAQTGVQAGGALWGVATWGQSLWGSAGSSEQTMRINGFVVLYETGDYV